MISNISLKNFQAHKNTELELSPYITAIIGSSDSGKTSILRSLYWAIQNKPNGVQMISYWNRKKDGSPKDATEVSLSMDGHTITRVRNSDRNGYDLDGKELSAIGRDVPEEITKFLNLSDINIAKQFDQHFLLSESSGEVARRLNEMVRLDLIDETLSKVEAIKRECRKDIATKTETKATLEASIAKLEFVTKAREILTSTEALEQAKIELVGNTDKLGKIIDLVEGYEQTITKAKKLLGKMSKVFTLLDGLLDKKEELASNIHKFQTIIDTLTKYNKEADKFEAIRKARRLFALLDSLQEDKDAIGKKMLRVADLMRQVNDLTKIAQEKYIEAKKEREALPEVCPHCEGTGFMLEGGV